MDPPGLADDRWRDLLPLPLYKPQVESTGRLSRESVSSKRHRVRRGDNLQRVNEAITALNALAGFDSPAASAPTKAQGLSNAILMRRIAQMPRPAVQPNMREAIHELLHLPASQYACEDEARSTVRPFNASLVSLPVCGASPRDATELIDPQGREVLEGFEHSMLLGDADLGMIYEKGKHVKPYMDETLRSSPQAYGDFVKDMFERGMLDFAAGAASVITPFFAAKKNGKLRLVLDCRASNQMFAHPPDIALAAGYTFSQLEVPSGETMYIAQSDVKDYFYSIGLPLGLRRFFCLPPVRGSQVDFVIPGFEGFDGDIYPRLKVVPMGWSWAMWIAQRIHQFQAALAVGCSPAQVLADGRPPPSLRGGHPILIPYADNMNVVGVDRQRVQDTKDKIAERLRDVGFIVHEEQEAVSSVQALGFIIDGARGEVRPIPLRLEKLRLALIWLSNRPRVSGRIVERIVGHCVHMFMLRRELLAVFRSMYDFKIANYARRTKLWASAAKEARWAAALLPLCFADLRKPWSATLTVSDACLSGTAVSALDESVENVRKIGQCREMWRFRAADPLTRAREAVLGLDPFADLESVKPIKQAKVDPFQLNLDFEHVPDDLACSPHWRNLFAARMTLKEHITILEGRATVQAVRHKLRSSLNFGCKHVHFGDNLGMVLAFDRGRAKSVPLLICCRRVLAYSIAGDSAFIHRWVPSEHNAADGPSRRWEHLSDATQSKRQSRTIKEALIYPNAVNRAAIRQAREFQRWTLGRVEEEDSTPPDQSHPNQESVAARTARSGRGHEGVKTAEAMCSRRPSQKRRTPVTAGSCCGGAADGRGVQAQDCPVSNVLSRNEIDAAKAERFRPSYAPLSRPVFLGRVGYQRRSQVHCSRSGLAATPHQGSLGPQSTGLARLEEPGPWKHQAPSGLANCGAGGTTNGSKWFFGRGPVGAPHVRNIHAPRRDVHFAEARPGEKQPSGPVVGCKPSPLRGGAGFQSRYVQREHPPGQPRTALAGRCPQLSFKCAVGTFAPDQLRPSQRCVDHGIDQSEAAQELRGAPPTSSLRCQLGSLQGPPDGTRSEAQGEMAVGQNPEALRAARAYRPTLREASSERQIAGGCSSKAAARTGPWKVRPALTSKRFAAALSK